MIFDTHCHYNLEPLYSGKKSHFRLKDDSMLLTKNWQDHWQKAQEHGVTQAIVVGTTIESSKVALEIAQQDENLYASVGIHPTEAEEITDVSDTLTQLETLLKGSKVVAIGEIGLDYFWLKTDASKRAIREKQKKLFAAQLDLAQKYHLPQIIHVRDSMAPETPTQNNAYWDVLEILEEKYRHIRNIEYVNKEEKERSVPFVLHCVSGALSYVLQALDLGGYVGFDGNLTYKKTSQLKKILRYTPFNRILVETDAPYLPPQSYRGQVCEPWMIRETVEYIESEFGIDTQTLQQNAHDFFGIK